MSVKFRTVFTGLAVAAVAAVPAVVVTSTTASAHSYGYCGHNTSHGGFPWAHPEKAGFIDQYNSSTGRHYHKIKYQIQGVWQNPKWILCSYTPH